MFRSNLVQVEIPRAGYSLGFPFFKTAAFDVGHEPGHIDNSRLGCHLLAQFLWRDNKRTLGLIGKRASWHFVKNCAPHEWGWWEANLDLTTLANGP